MLEIKNINKKYFTLDGEVTALNDFSVSISDGEFVAVTGKSGSGKTSLLNMISALDRPDSGSIIYNGKEITKLSAKKAALLRRNEIGMIYQFYNLIPELNVKENITLPAELNGFETDEKRLNSILNTVGLSGRTNAYPADLSGGQQQRAAIARAIYNYPKLLLADEPTGNLDGENTDQILSLLRELNEKNNVTVVMVTHSDAVARCAKRVLTLSEGKLISDRRYG